jgi:hypothetical protein
MYSFLSNITKVLFIVFLMLLANKILAFEGKILFVKENVFDTTHYCMYVKGNQIKLEQVNTEVENPEYYLVDIKANTLKIVNHSKKAYQSIKIIDQNTSNNIDIIKTHNSKDINGYKCYQWRIKNYKDDSEIAYWVTNNAFDFFDDFIRIIYNSNSIIGINFLIPEMNGVMPINIVERSLLRIKRASLSVIEIKDTKIPDTIFNLPQNYKLFDESEISDNL